ncbi:hypothetical protein RJ639_047032 [Escallonia herrerae]|uniref:DUF4283 domain-containing protein n=1 Tax=Escallonia herrerae TaxID=1293975 RepID=A0AA88W9Q4_9ASTE|nr:hypothetical protein RJ639_047032 [Escallonia herrerae]
MKKTVRLLWRATKGVTTSDLDQNLFIFRFTSEAEKSWVICQGPWHFENNLLVFKQFRGVEQPSTINGVLGHRKKDCIKLLQNLKPSSLKDEYGRWLQYFLDRIGKEKIGALPARSTFGGDESATEENLNKKIRPRITADMESNGMNTTNQTLTVCSQPLMETAIAAINSNPKNLVDLEDVSNLQF